MRSLGAEIRHVTVKEVLCETAEVILDDGERVQGDVVIGADGMFLFLITSIANP